VAVVVVMVVLVQVVTGLAQAHRVAVLLPNLL
jgi:hypothetical protein